MTLIYFIFHYAEIKQIVFFDDGVILSSDVLSDIRFIFYN